MSPDDVVVDDEDAAADETDAAADLVLENYCYDVTNDVEAVEEEEREDGRGDALHEGYVDDADRDSLLEGYVEGVYEDSPFEDLFERKQPKRSRKKRRKYKSGDDLKK